MSLKLTVEKIFRQFTDYKNPGQAVTQMSSLGSLSGDLYQDSKRFIYELLQNADDASLNKQKVSVSIRLLGDNLVVAHNGKIFDDRDVRGISGVADGTKKKADDKTGYKGIGFKAVFGQSERVTVYSAGEYFRFDAHFEHDWNPLWEQTQQEWETENERSFQYPWPIIPIFTGPGDMDPEIHDFLTQGRYQVATIIHLRKVAEVWAALRELAEKVEMYIFLKNINEIEFDNGKTTRIEILEDGLRVQIKVNETTQALWLKKTIELTVPDSVRVQLRRNTDMPEKIQSATRAEIVLAAKLKDGKIIAVPPQERRLYAYLPTEEMDYEIPVLVNAAFYMVANRESLHKQSEWNQWLFENIPVQLLNWIAELVNSSLRDQAYQLLPSNLSASNGLARAFNESLVSAKNNIPFILNSKGHLLTVQQALIDFTFLSEKNFVGQEVIRNYKMIEEGLNGLNAEPFVMSLDNRRLKSFGVSFFDWLQFAALLADPNFQASLDIGKNKALIMHLKNLSANEKVTDISEKILSDWPFVFDFNNLLRCPKDVFFPTTGELPDPASDLFFIHPELETWANENPDLKNWLEGLGIVEKSDITFLEKTIISKAEEYITLENAVKTIQSIFNLFEKGDIGKDVLAKLSRLKLLTVNGSLLPAEDCLLADEYYPRLKLQGQMKEDVFVSPEYMIVKSKFAEWRNFFTSISAHEGISFKLLHDGLSLQKLLLLGFEEGYFDTFKERFQPLHTKFTPYAYRNIATLFLLSNIKDYEIAKVFWADVIGFIDVADIRKTAIAYWGFSGYPSATTGDEVSNYLEWYVAHMPCLPATDGTCHPADSIFLNNEENKKMAGKHLPVFDGPELHPNWRAFFKFRSELKLPDYLVLLTKIADHPDSNKNAQQPVFEYLLEHYSLFNEEDLGSIRAWALAGRIADTSGNYQSAGNLYFYPDGDPAVFGSEYRFAYFSTSNQKRQAFANFLTLLPMKILSQSQFGLEAPNKAPASDLNDTIQSIIPYWAKWREKEKGHGYDEMLFELETYFGRFKILQADQLTITYEESWKKKVNIYFSNNELYVVEKWTASKVIMPLTEKLCELFQAKAYQSQLTFLLTSRKEEIIEYFTEESIGLPPVAPTEQPAVDAGGNKQPADQPENDYELTPYEHRQYEALWKKNLEDNTVLIQQSGGDPKKLLLDGLKANCPLPVVCIYHFSHLENAFGIIRDGAIKSRSQASFKDSAGSGIIAQTDQERKKFARFYFRGKTPTQYYVENLGRGENSMSRLGSDPICPVPVFFIIPLEQVMAKAEDWQVSLGTLASPNVKYGNEFDLVSQFDFAGVYKNMPDISLERFRVAAHQEFLVKDALDLSSIDYHLGVQDEPAKRSLLALLNDDTTWERRIHILPDLYHNNNARVSIDDKIPILHASLTGPHNGQFVLQHSTGKQGVLISSNKMQQSITEFWVTTKTEVSINLTGDSATTVYKLFYQYKGYLWLTYTNAHDSNFDTSWVKDALKCWIQETPNDIDKLLSILKEHPVLGYLYAQPVGGPDNLTLEQHTIAVIKNYLQYFPSKQNVFSTEAEFLLCLALHDIGKPPAMALGNKNLQHRETIRILNDIAPMLPFTTDAIERAKNLINGDPLGLFLNPNVSNDVNTTLGLLLNMAAELKMHAADFFHAITIYYQCDAGGYRSLKDRLFIVGTDNELEFGNSEGRLKFKQEYEQKFADLASRITIL